MTDVTNNIIMPQIPETFREDKTSEQYYVELERILVEMFGGDQQVAGNLDVGGFVTTPAVQFDINYVDGQAEGRLQWNIEDGTLEVGMPGGAVNLQIGQELLVRVTNDEGSQINNGQVVFVSGATGSNIEVQLPIASNPLEAPLTFGLATEDIAAGQKGYITLVGNVRDIDTSGPGAETWVDGDIVYLSATVAGGLTNVRPVQPNIGVIIGVVLRAHATEGVIAAKSVVIQRISLASDVLISSITDAQILAWDNGDSRWENKTPTSHTQVAFSMYDAEPARSSETSLDGAFLPIATAQPLDSGTDLVVSKGTGKLVVVVNVGGGGEDFVGEITVTGTSVDRDTGATTGADTDTLTIDALTTDNSDVDLNGNTRHAFTGAYITSKWFVGTVTLSTTDLTLTDVDVYHVSFEQFDDTSDITLDTFDANILTTSVNAKFDAYLYSIEVTGDKCDITREASLNVGLEGEPALADRYWRLRRGNINKAIDGTTDGTWVDVHYSNSPAFVEDVSIKVWATEVVPLTLT